MNMKVKEVAALTGISVRTLHHYDEIGLLAPDEVTETGYRLYSANNLDTLQQILFLRELGFPLKKIKEILGSPSFDRKEALLLQQNMLYEKRKHIDQMIATIEKTLLNMEGAITMSNKEKFEGFHFNHQLYEEEARKRWGDPAVDHANEKMSEKGKDGTFTFENEMNSIYKKLALLRHTAPESAEAQAAIAEWHQLLNKIGSYSLDAFKALGQMYVEDERFTKNIDQFGEGLARFMKDAMAFYASENKK